MPSTEGGTQASSAGVDPSGGPTVNGTADVEMKDADEAGANLGNRKAVETSKAASNRAPTTMNAATGDVASDVTANVTGDAKPPASSTPEGVIPASGATSVPEDDDDAMEGDEDAEGEEE